MADKPLERLEQFAIDVILERRYGKRAAALRFFLRILSWIYGSVMRLRQQAFDNHLLRSYSPGCLVISVGNLTVGGTGKTPIVERMARTLQGAGRRVAILSRGYKSRPRPFHERLARKLMLAEWSDPPRVVSDGQSLLLNSEKAGDEPYMLASNLKGVVVLVDKDRVKSALYATRKFGCDTLILDDGFQYLRLKERLNLVLVDRSAPFGNRHILPRGTLREPKDHLKRGDVIFITKSDGSDLSGLKEEIRRYNRHAEIIECAHSPRHLRDLYSDEILPLSYLQGKKIGAMAGIAVPQSFEAGLEKLGAEIIYSRHYADHHRFSEQEVLNAISRTRARGGLALITTEKDAVRFPDIDSPPVPMLFLRVEIEILRGREHWDELLGRLAGEPLKSGGAKRSAAAAL